MNPAPRLLGERYEVGGLLGRGGMAEVHVGRDSRLGRTVAVKMLRSDLARDPSFQARFRREAQSAAALNHPSVVAVYDSGEEPGVDGGASAPYIVMEYVEGRTLRELLTGGQTMPWREALRVTSSVLAALSYSHRAGIVHRDIKPANVMLTPSGDVKVMDFGIARAMADTSATMTQTQAVIGTAQYLSPEQARGETVDARSDLYSAGCLLFELLTGRPPFVADSPVAVAYQHVGETPLAPSTFNPQVPHPVDAIVLHSLVKHRDGRYQSAEDFRDDVEAALAGRRISAAALGAAEGLAGAAAATEAITGVPWPGDSGGAADAMAAMPAGSAPTQTMTTQSTGEPDLPQRRDDREPPRRTGLWVLLGLLIAALVAVSALVLPGLLRANPSVVQQQVAVPNVVDQTVAAATATLNQQGLKVGQRTDAADDQVPEGSVVSQDPASGTVPAGTSVALVVSAGPDTVDVPDLAGQTQDEAAVLLEQAGLQLGEVTDVESTERAKGEVVSSDPASGEPVAPDTKIDLQVANGQVDVPNVIGLSLVDATARLTEAGLAVDGTDYRDSTQPENTVIAQSRQGKTVDKGTKVKLVIARPPATPTPTQTPTATPPPTTPSPTTTPPGTPTTPPTSTASTASTTTTTTPPGTPTTPPPASPTP